jgi:hypothetical protein
VRNYAAVAARAIAAARAQSVTLPGQEIAAAMMQYCPKQAYCPKPYPQPAYCYTVDDHPGSCTIV